MEGKGKFFNVYRMSPSGRLYCLVFHLNPRLKIEPLSLLAFAYHHPQTFERGSFCFSEAWKDETKYQLSLFYSFTRDKRFTMEEYRKYCSFSLQTLFHHLKDFDFTDFGYLMDTLF